MCVIMVVGKTTRPTEEMVKRAFEHNKDGFGIAYRGGAEVLWKKGIMNVDEAVALCAETACPYVAHFRVASVGGIKKSLTHPFPIHKNTGLALEGHTKGNLLFHNGHWTQWEDKALDAAIASNTQIPSGEWSDTRAIAWMISIYGNGFMELLTQQKGVIFGPDTMHVFTGRDGWDKINNVWCSNDYFWKDRGFKNYGTGRLCRTSTCSDRVTGGRDYCDKCESKRSQTVSLTEDDKEEPSSSAATTEGKVVPSAIGVLIGNPLVRLLSLEQAERVYRAGGMSKSKVKEFRKQWGNMNKDKGKKDRATKRLLYLSQLVGESMLNGSIH